MSLVSDSTIPTRYSNAHSRMKEVRFHFRIPFPRSQYNGLVKDFQGFPGEGDCRAQATRCAWYGVEL